MLIYVSRFFFQHFPWEFLRNQMETVSAHSLITWQDSIKTTGLWAKSHVSFVIHTGCIKAVFLSSLIFPIFSHITRLIPLLYHEIVFMTNRGNMRRWQSVTTIKVFKLHRGLLSRTQTFSQTSCNHSQDRITFFPTTVTSTFTFNCAGLT